MKLHLGCGKRYIPGYVHIDAVDFPHVDHVSSIDRLSFIGDNSVDVIYNCHVLERSEEHTSELQSRVDLVCRLLLEKKKKGGRPTPRWLRRDRTHTSDHIHVSLRQS